MIRLGPVPRPGHAVRGENANHEIIQALARPFRDREITRQTFRLFSRPSSKAREERMASHSTGEQRCRAGCMDGRDGQVIVSRSLSSFGVTFLPRYRNCIMPSSDKDRKAKGKKESQLVIRLEKDLRDQFVAACKDVDTSAAREIRRFMKQFLVRYERGELEE